MRKAIRYFLTSMLVINFSVTNHPFLQALESEAQESSQSDHSLKSLAAFTGKVTKNKVRLRLQPNLESRILKELNRGDLIIVEGESEDFYAVRPPLDLKAYVFRSYVLDNVVEASHVNVRLEPDTDAQVIAQLNQGDRVEGNISPLNSKWLEITPPASTFFYIAKDYVENIGDSQLIQTLEKRKNEANALLVSANATIEAELQKPYPEMNMDPAFMQLNQVINHYADFQEQNSRAKELIMSAQEQYLHKKISYLENEAKKSEAWKSKNSQLTHEIKIHQEKLSQLEQEIHAKPGIPSNAAPSGMTLEKSEFNTEKMLAWLPIEYALYSNWIQEHPGKSMKEFYHEQMQNSMIVQGLIEPYNRNVKNKPGDYILVNKAGLPIAYLYSTQVNLNEQLGKLVNLKVATRPHNNFAFPAYFVLTVE